MDSIWLDLRSGFGQLRRAPLVAAAAVLTLAVGIGVTTAVFSFVAAVLDAPSALRRLFGRRLPTSTPISRCSTFRLMQAILDADLQGSLVLVQVLNAFAMAALGLAGLGIWGVAAQVVAQRTREIGLRVALGASTAQVLRATAWLLLPQVALGSLTGLAIGLGVARLLQSVLFQVSPADPVTIAATVAALTTVAAAALLGPARRAARVDPVIALRQE